MDSPAGAADGGFAPQAGVEESNWVTALVALLRRNSSARSHTTAPSDGCCALPARNPARCTAARVAAGQPLPPEQAFAGWPWTTGAAGWVGPTSLAILALEREGRRRPSAEISRRIADGRQFLVRRTCREGGWNYGAPRALGYDSGRTRRLPNGVGRPARRRFHRGPPLPRSGPALPGGLPFGRCPQLAAPRPDGARRAAVRLLPSCGRRVPDSFRNVARTTDRRGAEGRDVLWG